jgi:hypothetical protein
MQDSGDSAEATAAAEFLGRAYVATAAGGLRAAQRLAGILTAHGATIAEAVAAETRLPEAERRRRLDDLRRLARELGDAATQEARHYQSELDKLALALVLRAESDAVEPGPHRYARAKP